MLPSVSLKSKEGEEDKMTEIKKAIEVKRNFLGYIKKLARKAAQYEDYSYYTYDNILKNQELVEKYLVVLNGTQIVDILFTKDICGITFVYPFLTERYSKQYTEDAILKHYKGTRYVVSVDVSLSEKFKECNMTASYDNDCFYRFEGDLVQYVPADGDENLVRDAFEATRFPEYEENKIVFKTYEGKDARQYLFSKEWDEYPIAGRGGGFGAIAGFHYMDLNYEDNNSLFVAEINSMPIAAIKTGLYYEDQSKYTHIGVNFIDVCKPYRQKGLATRIIKEFSKKHRDFPLVLSHESDMGKLCRMKDHFKKYIPDAYATDEWENHCMEIARKELMGE